MSNSTSPAPFDPSNPFPPVVVEESPLTEQEEILQDSEERKWAEILMDREDLKDETDKELLKQEKEAKDAIYYSEHPDKL